MLSLFAAVSCAFMLATGAAATPARRATCTPNAQGAGVSIESLVSGLEWGVSSTPASGSVLIGESFRGLAAPDFHVQEDGQVATSFIIRYTEMTRLMDGNTYFSFHRDVDNDNLAVTTITGDQLAFETAASSGTEPLVSP